MRLQLGALVGLAMLALAACGATAAPAPAVQQSPALAPVTTSLEVASAPASPAASAAAESQQPAVSATPSTSPAASASSSAAAVPTVPVKPTPASFRLGPLVYLRQTLNNCGPAAIAEVLHFWGVEQTQRQAQAALRPDGNSRGMWPYPVPAYVSKLGMSSLMGVGGNPTMLKALVANGFPVIVSQWVSATDHEGHYREIEGFDDASQVYVSTDSYLGPNHEISYAEFNQIWTGNQRFMIVYPPAKQPLLNAVLASVGWNKAAAYQADIIRQQTQQPTDPGAPRGFFRPGDRSLGLAWAQLQIGDLAAAKAALQQATAQGANPLMATWVSQAVAAAASSPAA